MEVRDANGVLLGRLLSFSLGIDAIWVLTSTKYLVSINLDGSISPAQIYWTVGTCTGTPYLYADAAGTKILGKLVVRSANGSLYAPATVAPATGLSTSQTFTAAGLENPTCGPNAGQRSGWLLTAVSRATIGLPTTIATPLQY